MNTQPQANVGRDLVLMHKVITRALDMAVQTSLDGSLQEALCPGFVMYMHTLTILLAVHHDGEEMLVFPFWKERLPSGPFDQLKRQHGWIRTQLDQVAQWAESCRHAWHADAFRALYPAAFEMRNLWRVHAALEEASLGTANAAQYLTPEENAQLSRQWAEYGQAHSQPIEQVLPFILFNLPTAEREEFARPFPAEVIQVLVPGEWKPLWEPMQPFLLAE